MITRRTIPWSLIAPVAILVGVVFWALWPVLTGMAHRWSTDPRYAHGYLVPLFSLALLWIRRETFLEAMSGPRTSGQKPQGSELHDEIAGAPRPSTLGKKTEGSERGNGFVGATFRPTTWGLAFIAAGGVFQLLGGYFLVQSIEARGVAFLSGRYRPSGRRVVGAQVVLAGDPVPDLHDSITVATREGAGAAPSIAGHHGQHVHAANSGIHGVFRR